jgi:murein DD-endopeptidase MepM/ murein hydrolase activator NlpD
MVYTYFLHDGIYLHNKMKPLIYGFGIFLVCASAGCSVSNNPQRTALKLLQKGKIKDDSSFIYHLPYEENKSHLVVQGYFSSYTHKNRAALDFKMRKGTKVCAVRDGIVVRLKEDGNKGGSDPKYRPFGNFVVIQHQDSSRTGYWHLQFNGVLVNMGDTVKQGQVIGLSGKTGYTYFPHLHFIVWRSDGKGKWTQIGTRFKTNKGIRYLRPFRSYRNQTPTG